MSKSIKPKNNTFIDASGVTFNRTLLSDLLNKIDLKQMRTSVSYDTIDMHKFGIYTFPNGDSNLPYSGAGSWFVLVVIPVNLNDEALLICWSRWFYHYSSHAYYNNIWVKGPLSSWKKISVS